MVYGFIGRSVKLVCNRVFTFNWLENHAERIQHFKKISLESAASLLLKVFILFSSLVIVAASPHKAYAGNALLLTLTKTDVTCNGYSNGTITSALAGGSDGTVNYTLSPGSVSNTTGVFNNLPADFYIVNADDGGVLANACLLYTSPSPRDGLLSR